MGLFSKSQMDEINSIAQKSKEPLGRVKQSKSVTSFQHEIDQASKAVLEYFRDSEAILITSKEELHEYVLKAIEAGYCGIDTETTGLDRIHDTIVGTCLYYPGGVEAYIPSKHIVPVFDVLYNNQLSYEDVGEELQLFVEAKTKMIFANADFDLAFIYKDLHVDMIPICYYDVILAWRCLKEDEQNNGLKPLYCKYVLKGQADAKRFSDFFSPKIFPYCNPEVAKLYAANDAKITYELFMWQLPYVTKTHPKCQKHHLEKIADLIWNIEIPMIEVCALMHRTGVYYDRNTRDTLKIKYDTKSKQETNKLADMIQEVIDNADSITISKSPFKTGQGFNEGSAVHVKYLLTKFLGCDVSSGDKETLRELNLPITKQILAVRAANKLLNTFIDKLPNEVGKDGRIHSTFKSIGADTGRMSSEKPNVQQIPSHAIDIRHQFRATPSTEQLGTCTVVNGCLQITLGSYDSVTVTDNDQSRSKKDVIDLCVGDYVISKSGSIQVNELINNLPYTTIIFSSFEQDSEVKIPYVTPAYVMMSSDYSQQEPKITAYISQDPSMVNAFKEGKDIYATIASLSFNKPYEECLEFNPITGANQPEGKSRRTQAKSIVLGITYGRSTKTIGDQLFGTNKNMSDEDKTKEAQKIYDAVLNAFPNLRSFMIKAQNDARKQGYVETILGRRRHIPDMQLPMYEFKAMPGYINPDIDPLDPTTLTQKNEIPPRIIEAMEKEIYSFKYFGQVAKYIKKLSEQKIKVINNNQWITNASRKCVNSIVQGSAAELTKIAMLKIFHNEEWKQLGARVLLPVHDELIAEVPIRNYKRAEELLSQMMSDAGNFLPFKISCDVTTTLRWYGLEYPCAYTKPNELALQVPSNMSEDEIKWIQYHLFEMEYSLPIIPNDDGSKLEGDDALGVNGKWTKELEEHIFDYINRYKLSTSEFIDHIYKNVTFGLVN